MKLKITAADVASKGEDHVCCDLADSAVVIHELGGVVTIHAHGKSNSIEGIANAPAYKAALKTEILKRHIDFLEIGNADRERDYIEKVFPNIGFELPLILCSDNHNIGAYAPQSACWLRADPTFRGLLMALREPRDRVYIGDRPPGLVRVEANRTKFIRSIRFDRKSVTSSETRWFSGEIPFNSGLVAIIGNKGSGKSALADMLGLLGASTKCDCFSFLNSKRFRHPNNGFAKQYEATLEWESGETITLGLDQQAKVEEVERIKYLPQDHVERVCNELVVGGKEGFEQELKSVIFSHVPENQRLGQPTLDDLVRFETVEKQNRIDSLQKQLREVSRLRVVLETQADPAMKRELEEKIKRRQADLDAHLLAQPNEVLDPASLDGVSTIDHTLASELESVENKRSEISQKISTANTSLSSLQRRLAVSKRALEKLENFQKEFDTFLLSLEEDATELGLNVADLAALTIETSSTRTIRDDSATKIQQFQTELNSPELPGLVLQLGTVDSSLAELQRKLDAPNRTHQAFLKALSEWNLRKKEIEGDDSTTDSLTWLRTAYQSLNALPAKIQACKNDQVKLARQIYSEKRAQARVYSSLYEPVQQFIDTHRLAKDKLRLEFRAELVVEDFADRLLALLAQNKRGSFMLLDEGRTRAEALVRSTDSDDEASVFGFLEEVDRALHFDLRDPLAPAVQLKDQLAKGKKSEEVFELIYGLEHMRPRYILRWEGKDLHLLSPGERGTLLLVFYLLIDRGEMPLVIDQPEGNLDNHTVAKILVDCLRETRNKRQVFIVTHNPNLAVVCDADQIVHASMNKEDGFAVTYTSGALENPKMSQVVTDVLEGTRWAFSVRSKKYHVGEKWADE